MFKQKIIAIFRLIGLGQADEWTRALNASGLSHNLGEGITIDELDERLEGPYLPEHELSTVE
jgi:hypothetical protein